MITMPFGIDIGLDMLQKVNEVWNTLYDTVHLAFSKNHRSFTH